MSTSLGRWFTELAQAGPDKPSITFEEHTITREELDSAANRLARAYALLGVSAGDYVTINLPNSIEFYLATIATWKLGATPQPVSYRLPRGERDGIVALVKPALLVGVSSDQAGDRPSVPQGFEPDPSLSDAPMEQDITSTAWVAIASGGSTGQPKVIVSGRPAEAELHLDRASRFVFADSTQLVLGPLYHNGPFGNSMWGLIMGQHVVVLARFDATAALEAIQTYDIGGLSLVPTMMHRMLKVIKEHPGRYDLSSLQRVWHMAAPCPEWLKVAWIDLVGPDKLWEVYGATEGQTATVISGREWLEHRGSVGRAEPGQLRVLDEEGNDLPAGEVGEVYMRRPVGAPPTYRYIGAEARVLQDWESVGDMGWLDADGYLYLSDRRTDMIISGGANVYPAEVEGALLEHPMVDGAIVVGLPDEDLGQRVHAVVQAHGGLTTPELTSFLSERLVRYKIPRSFRFTDEALRDDAGKARRSAIRDRELVLLSEMTSQGGR